MEYLYFRNYRQRYVFTKYIILIVTMKNFQKLSIASGIVVTGMKQIFKSSWNMLNDDVIIYAHSMSEEHWNRIGEIIPLLQPKK